MGWTMFYLFVALKLPIAALAWIIWWAVRAEPEPAADEPEDDGGISKPRHPREPLPRPPRRGPHGDPAPASPSRSRRPRPVTARGRLPS